MAPACILGTNYPALEPTAGQQHLTQLYVARTHQVNSIRLARLVPQTDLIVAGGEDFIPICDGKILADQVPSYWSEEAARENLAVPRPALRSTKVQF